MVFNSVKYWREGSEMRIKDSLLNSVIEKSLVTSENKEQVCRVV